MVGGNCQSPTQPQPELELDLIMGRNPPPRVYCHFCTKYQDRVHFCTEKKVYVNFDKSNRLVIESLSHFGAEREADLDGKDNDYSFFAFYKNIWEMDQACFDRAKKYREIKEEIKETLLDEKTKREHEEKEVFKATMMNKGIDIKVIEKWLSNLSINFLVTMFQEQGKRKDLRDLVEFLNDKSKEMRMMRSKEIMMSPEEKMMLDKGQKDIVKFDNTMKSFHIGKEEVEKFMDNLETNFPKLKRFKIKLDQYLVHHKNFFM